MTLPSRKKHPTTARRCTKQATADRTLGARGSLRRLLRGSLCLPLTCVVGSIVSTPTCVLAQNPLRSDSQATASQRALTIQTHQPTWSPTPYQANPLRESQSSSRAFDAAAKTSTKSAAMGGQAIARPTSTKSIATAGDSSNQAQVLRWRKVDSPTVTAKQPSAPVVTTAAFQDSTPKQPRSSLLVQQPKELPVGQSQQSQPAPQALALPEQESLLPPTPTKPAIPAPRLEIPRSETPTIAEPPALTLPPATEPPGLKLPPVTTEAIRQTPSVQPPEPMPESVLPNPFPKPSVQDRSVEPLAPASPSDRKLRDPAKLDEPAKRDDDDLPPAPPKRAEQSVANCELVRSFAAGADIRKFQLDSSPEFVQGYQSADRPGSLTKENFIQKSQNRTWRGSQGEHIAEGRLVDLVYGTVVIQQSDGKRVSYLQRLLSDADQVYVSEAWGIPVTCPLGDQGFAPRFFVDSTFTWKASGACNKPLYFEDVSLERYGHEWGPVVQPVVSTVRFFGDLAVLPYKMGIHPPNECQHPLGFYRPGSCAPWSIKPVPLSLRGAVTQAAFVTGTVFTLP